MVFILALLTYTIAVLALAKCCGFNQTGHGQ